MGLPLAHWAAMDFSVFFAGTAGSVPTARRGLPALLVRRGADRILFDCGEGTQRQLVSSVGLTDLTEVFLTHFHADHWLGLPGLLKTFDLRGREKPLTVHGPRGVRELLALGQRAAGRVRFELDAVGARAGRGARARRLQDRGGSGGAPRPRVRVRTVRGRAARDVRPAGGDRPRVVARPRVRPRAARRDRQGRHARAGARSGAPRAQARDLRRHGAVRGAAGRRPWGGRADPRGDIRRGRARPCRRDRPLDRRPGGGARTRSGRAAARADPLLDPLSGRRAARRGARDLRAHRAAA